MSKPRNFPIDIAQGTSKRVTFVAKDQPDLSTALIELVVKKHSVDTACVIVKQYDPNLSNDLASGKFIFSFDPADTQPLDPRTYVYQIKITMDEGTFVPIQGDFVVWNSIS